MRLRKLTLRHFRNVGFAALELEGRQQFLIGANGQGKTNLIEAAGFLTALRSFRTTDNRLLIGHGQQVAAIAGEQRFAVSPPWRKRVWRDPEAAGTE